MHKIWQTNFFAETELGNFYRKMFWLHDKVSKLWSRDWILEEISDNKDVEVGNKNKIL